jgi:hypothetical protein
MIWWLLLLLVIVLVLAACSDGEPPDYDIFDVFD